MILYGYHYSVYTRIVRMTLLEKGIAWRHVEVDPFAEDVAADYLALNPFGRVPTLVDDDFVLYETVAMTRYIDEAAGEPSLQPADARQRARMAQIISIADAYAYWPLVRQVFSHRVFRPTAGEPADDAEVAKGLAKASRVLAAFEALIDGGAFLVGGRLSLADLHLAPMIAAFAAAPEGREMLRATPKLSAWWRAIRQRQSLYDTETGLPGSRKS